MKYIFLINSFSTREKTEDTIRRVDLAAKTLDLDYEIRVNSPELSTENILKEYQNEKNIIVAIGGDGTINRIVNAIYGTNNAISLLPLGTGNDFSRSVNEQMKDGLNKIDLVKINDAYFINLVCFGIDADIANDERYVGSKIVPRSQRYNATIVANFLNFKGKHFKISVDNLIYENDYVTVAVCNGKYYGRGFIMGPRARIDDGIIDVYMIEDMNKLALIKTILGLRKGEHEKNPKTKSFQTDKVIIESDKPISCNYDGEKMTSKKFEIEVIHHGLELYYNKDLQTEFEKTKVKKK